MKTMFEQGFYKGHPTISIWEVDEAGNKVGKRPIVSMGFKKLAALFSKQEEVKNWLRSKIQPDIEGLDV